MMAVSEEHKKLTDQHITKIAKKISVSKIKTLAVKEMQFKFEEIEVIKEAKKDNQKRLHKKFFVHGEIEHRTKSTIRFR